MTSSCSTVERLRGRGSEQSKFARLVLERVVHPRRFRVLLGQVGVAHLQRRVFLKERVAHLPELCDLSHEVVLLRDESVDLVSVSVLDRLESSVESFGEFVV